jgi:hypothetical protein
MKPLTYTLVIANHAAGRINVQKYPRLTLDEVDKVVKGYGTFNGDSNAALVVYVLGRLTFAGELQCYIPDCRPKLQRIASLSREPVRQR